SSTTGRRPAMAAPTPAPTKVASEIGVSRTRSSPNASRRPRVTPKIPPMSETSSPMTNTRSSRVISACSASLRASAIVRSGPRRSAGSVTGACGAYTDDSMISTVGSALSVAKRTARSSSPSTASSSSFSLMIEVPRRSSSLWSRAGGDGGARRRPRARRRERVLVVLAEVDDRQLPDGGQIQRLVDHTLIGAAVAEERDDDAVGAADATGEGGPGADRQAGGDDAV